MHSTRFPATFVLALLASPALAQDDAPRVTATDADGAATEVVLNEVNQETYPDVRLFVTVLQDGTPISGLGADDFRVREDEVDQAPLTVDPQLPPLSVVLAVDTSGSMAPAMDAAKAAAGTFLDTLGAEDGAQVLGFAREVSEVTGMTTDRAALDTAIGGLSARGDTALYDALARSVELIGAETGRKAIVLLSDGVDDDGAGRPLSEATAESVLDEAAAVNVPIFVVGLGPEIDTEGLTRIADGSGGRFLSAEDASALGSVYESIGSQLGGQYSVSYTSSLPADGVARRVDLAVGDLQASKTYTPEAQAAAPGPAEAAGGTCEILALYESYIPEYAEIVQMEEEGLINGQLRFQQVKAMQEDMFATLDEGTPDSACAKGLYDALAKSSEEKTMDVTTVDQMIRKLSERRAELCLATARTAEDFVPCLGESGALNETYRGIAQKPLAEPFAEALATEMEMRPALAFLRDAVAGGTAIANVIQTQVMERIMAE